MLADPNAPPPKASSKEGEEGKGRMVNQSEPMASRSLCRCPPSLATGLAGSQRSPGRSSHLTFGSMSRRMDYR